MYILSYFLQRYSTKFSARVLQQKQQLLFALRSPTLFQLKVALYRVNHSFYQFQHLFLRCLPLPFLFLHALADKFALFDCLLHKH
jgi:hypothetical protein